jgi:hypothetical protein
MIKLNLEVKKNYLCYQVLEQDVELIPKLDKGYHIGRYKATNEYTIISFLAPGIPVYKLWNENDNMKKSECPFCNRIYIRGILQKFDNLRYYRAFESDEYAEFFKSNIIKAFTDMKNFFKYDSTNSVNGTIYEF